MSGRMSFYYGGNSKPALGGGYVDNRFEMDMKMLLGKMDRMEGLLERVIEAIYYSTTKQNEEPTRVQFDVSELEEGESPIRNQEQDHQSKINASADVQMIEIEQEINYEPEDEHIEEQHEPIVEEHYEQIEALIDIETEPPVAPEMLIKKEIKVRTKLGKRPRSSRCKEMVTSIKRDRYDFDGPCDLPIDSKEIEIMENWLNESDENYQHFLSKLIRLRDLNQDQKKVLRQLFTDDVYDLYTFDAEKQPRNFKRSEMRRMRIFTSILQETFEIGPEEAEDLLKREIVLGRKRNVARGIRPAVTIVQHPQDFYGASFIKSEQA